MTMVRLATTNSRVILDGKGFRLGGKKFHIKGVCYGPFEPHPTRGGFASPEQTAVDFTQLRELGANVIRIYEVPPPWLLDLAGQNNLKILVDIPWRLHLCFLDSGKLKEEARETVRNAVRSCGKHPAVLAFSVANEIPPDIVRWSGAQAVAEFIDELVLQAKAIDPDCLCTFGNFPPTEFLRPLNVDFLCFNVYLHNKEPLTNYLARLQMIADTKPLVLGEFGMDSLREGESHKSETLGWQIETFFRAGLAGAVVFSYTDDWWRGGEAVTDWELGLTSRNRSRKESFFAVQKAFSKAPYFPLPQYPRVSVVVASYQGGRTLNACLESLEKLNYPDYEIILVDDGSTDGTAQIAEAHKRVRYFRHSTNLGLSVARNTGIAAAQGGIIAFTDSDCRADEDWLYHLVKDLQDGGFEGIGGHNLLPPEDSSLAAAVMVSPGGPAHVMLTDRQAEHIPGCNMAFYAWALNEIGNFDPIFRRAGDDVDICWRLQQRGFEIGFSPAGFVWHYRRSNVRAYLRQQQGYGEAEALLVGKHPEYFNLLGGSIWRGRIYAPSNHGILTHRPIIYRGVFGSSWFQTLYTSQPAGFLNFLSSFEYHVFVTLPLFILSTSVHFLFNIAMANMLVSLCVCLLAGFQAEIPRGRRKAWSKPLVGVLYFLQPIVRGWARYRGQLGWGNPVTERRESLDSVGLRTGEWPLDRVSYWGDRSVDRIDYIKSILEKLDKEAWPNQTDSGWNEFDIEVLGNRWARVRLTTAGEDYPKGGRMIRCRLKALWTLKAKTVFWSMVGTELLTYGAFGRWNPLLLLVAISAPLFILAVNHQKRNLQSLMIVFLDEIAKQWSLSRVPFEKDSANGKDSSQ